MPQWFSWLIANVVGGFAVVADNLDAVRLILTTEMPGEHAPLGEFWPGSSGHEVGAGHRQLGCLRRSYARQIGESVTYRARVAAALDTTPETLTNEGNDLLARGVIAVWGHRACSTTYRARSRRAVHPARCRGARDATI